MTVKEYWKEVLKNEESTCFILATLISAETLLDRESCNASLRMLNEIESVVDETDISDERKEFVRAYVKKGKKIVEDDLTRFNGGN